MIFVFAAFVMCGFLVWRGRVGQVLRGQWRPSAAILSIGVLAAAGFEAIRGGAIPALFLLVVGLVLLGTARWPRARAPFPAGDGMSASEARSILGVPEAATPAEIKAAHARLIRVAHPDAGGTSGLAAQLNAARDRLLKG